MDKRVDKFIDGVLIKAELEHQEDVFKEMLLKSGTVLKYESEVKLVDSVNDDEKFDVYITRTLVPAKAVSFIDVQFIISPSSGSTFKD